ncbi:MAG: hypothetical protein EXS08_08570 [Planctomycetes bacterium]|nr:hypothetical protein [Planctomycetota bacterium]
MTHRKNLLEAFQTKSEAPRALPPSPVSSGPRGPLFDAAAAHASGGQPPRWLLVGVGFVICFALGFALGRRTPGETRAAEDARAPVLDPRPAPVNQPRVFQEPPTAPAAAVAESGARLEDSPLFQAQNLYTVIVASYSKSNQDLAWATYQHLSDAKLAVFPPIESGNLAVVLVGAAPTYAELEKTEQSVKSLARDGKKPYASAYRVRIDKLIPRPNASEKKP